MGTLGVSGDRTHFRFSQYKFVSKGINKYGTSNRLLVPFVDLPTQSVPKVLRVERLQ